MKGLLLLISLCAACFVRAQYFEGIITYDFGFESHDAAISVDKLYEDFGTQATTLYKNGYFKELTDGSFMNYMLYRHEDTAVYYMHNYFSDTALVIRTDKPFEIETEYLINRNVDTILGYSCDLLTVTRPNKISQYFFSPELALDPSYYATYSDYGKFEILKFCKAHYLKLIISNGRYTLKMNATSVTHKKFKESVFELPPDKVLMKSPY